MNEQARQEPSTSAADWPECVMVGPGAGAQGGVATVVQVLAAAGLAAQGRVQLLTSHSAGGSSDKLRAAVTSLTAYLLLLARGKAAVLHVHVSSNASFWRKALFIWSAALFRRKVVFHLHGGGFRAFFESRNPLVRRLVAATMRRSDRVLCLSTPVAAWLKSLLPGVRVDWWPNPVPEDLLHCDVEGAVQRPVVLFLGALLPAKGVDDLLSAFQSLHELHGDAQLVIAGVGPAEADLKLKVIELGLESAVRFTGWIGPDERARWLGCARTLVLPSHLESQPMVLLEAMAAGLPVISTNVGGVPDIVLAGESGLLVEPRRPDQLADALSRVWADPDLRANLAVKARQRVRERHSASVVSAALLDLYDELASNRGMGRL